MGHMYRMHLPPSLPFEIIFDELSTTGVYRWKNAPEVTLLIWIGGCFVSEKTLFASDPRLNLSLIQFLNLWMSPS